MERRRWTTTTTLLLLLLLLCLIVLVTTCIAGSLETDRVALERFKQAVNATGTRLAWVSGTNPCTWTGVQCFQNRVAVVRLSGFQFTGAMPANTLADLDQLRVLSLHHNRFTGAFPLDLARLASLRALFLGYNLFSGPLPDFTGLWPRLSHFDVQFNNFSGDIPDSLNALTHLLVLELQSNAFSGKIPELRLNLVRFSVAENALEGPVPLSLQTFPNSSFAGNGQLCGPPTGTLCESPASPSPVALETPTAPMATAAAPIGDKRLMSVGAIAGVAVGASAVVVFLVGYLLFCCCCCRRRRGDDYFENSHVGKQVTHYNGEETNGMEYRFNKDMTRSPGTISEKRGLQFLDQGKRQEFGLEELLQASAEVLGKGSTGTSYKADMASCNCVVVVKRVRDVAADRKEFETHVEKLGRLRHRHLLPLRAYYFSRDEKLLVTDFMPRGSLYSLLHGERQGDRAPLNWASREKIALGSARALAYLHKPCVKMAHGNIKSCNVLLNRDYEPYLSDYGMTPLLNVPVSRFAGYRATEVTDIRQVSMQSDVYSFGVLLLELITGKAPRNDDDAKDMRLDLPRWIMSVGREDWSVEAFDPELTKTDKNYVEEEMAQMLQLAVACVDRMPERRPKMDELVLLLEDITQLGTSNDSSIVCPRGKSDTARSRSVSCGPTPLYTRPSSGVFVVE